MRIVMSSGHGRYIRGASGILEEVVEARRVVTTVASLLTETNVDLAVFHDNTSTSQNENLNTIIDFHNSQQRDLDVSVHFNAYVETTSPMGTEVLYVTQQALARKLSAAIAAAAKLPDRGAKYRDDLFFLNSTSKPAILIETCFVDSQADAEAYQRNYTAICTAIAETLTAQPTDPPTDSLFHVRGTCSWFGGPNDSGVSADEGLAFLYNLSDAPHLFLPSQPPETSGLARRLDPNIHYIACRWDYDVTPKQLLRNQTLKALVRAKGREFLAYPADWGPHQDTGRVADLSPALLAALDISTDDVVEVTYPSNGA